MNATNTSVQNLKRMTTRIYVPSARRPFAGNVFHQKRAKSAKKLHVTPAHTLELVKTAKELLAYIVCQF
jgi:hypothetical protein